MSTDNRTELNDCDNVTGFVGDGASPSLNTLTGQRYEGTGAIDTQHTNADEQMHTTQTSGGGGTFNLDLSDSTMYLLMKDNLVDTFANGGVQLVIGDGTDLIGYDTGGNDAVGLPLSPFFNAYKMDISVHVASPGTNNAYTGSEAALAQTAITQMGYGSLHLAKAQGNVANVFLDRMTYIANGSYALTINGGTVGVPETMADVQGDDVTNGWGMINNPLGSQYGFFAPTEWGDAGTANSYFTADGEQWFWIGDNSGGHAVGATHFPFRLIGNATGTNSWVVANTVIVNTGTRAEFDLSNANMDIVELDAVTFTDLGAITFAAANDADKHVIDCIFNNCDQLDFGATDADGCVINGSNDALAAVLWSTTPADVAFQDNFSFNSDGTGHAIEINLNTASLTTYNIDGYAVTGYETVDDGVTGNTVFIVDNALDGDVTINVSNGSGTFSYERAAGYTGTVTVNSTFTVTITVLDEDGLAVEGARVRVEETDGTLVTQGETNASGVYTDNVSVTVPLAVNIKTRLKGFRNFRTTGTITSSGLSVGVRFVADPIVDLP